MKSDALGVIENFIEEKIRGLLEYPMNEFQDPNWVQAGQVLVLIENKERCCEYSLIQHPSLPEATLKRWHPKKPKRGLKSSFQSTTLDVWLKEKEK